VLFRSLAGKPKAKPAPAKATTARKSVVKSQPKAAPAKRKAVRRPVARKR
jgi:hypothetical protein